MRGNKGITLIALVITIIVLLILAGVSIAMLTGENGLLTQATTTKKEQIRAEAAEKINLALNSAYSKVLQGKMPTEAEDMAGLEMKDNEGTIEATLGTAVTDAKVVEITWTPGNTATQGEAITGSIEYNSTTKAYTVKPATK